MSCFLLSTSYISFLKFPYCMGVLSALTHIFRCLRTLFLALKLFLHLRSKIIFRALIPLFMSQQYLPWSRFEISPRLSQHRLLRGCRSYFFLFSASPGFASPLCLLEREVLFLETGTYHYIGTVQNTVRRWSRYIMAF